MAWIGNKKVDDRIPQTWIIECLKIYKISVKIINLIIIGMEKLKGEFDSGSSNHCKSELPSRHHPRRLTLATAISFSNDATQLRILEMYRSCEFME